MNNLHTRIQKLFLATLGLAAAMLPTASFSQPGDLASQPIFTQNAVDPNIILVIDDSSSMDFEVLFPTNDGALYWDASNDSFHSITDGTVTNNSDKYVYLFPNGEGFSSGRRKNIDSNNHHAIPPFIQYAFARSADYNKAYFNPAINYAPWTSYGSQTFGNITPTNAPADPHSGRDTDKFDLTGNIYYTGTGEQFTVENHMIIPKGTVSGGSTTPSTGDVDPGSEQQLSVEYKIASYYRVVTTGEYEVNNLSDVEIDGDCSTPNPDHFKFLERRPGSFDSDDNVASLGPDGRCLELHTIDASDTDAMQNFANWFSYYRKRHLALRAGLTAAFDDISGVRVGIFTINDRNNVTMKDFDTQKDSVFFQIYNEEVSGGTPNRQALDYAGNQFKRTNSGAPITAECQKNFTIFFTDGYTSLGGTKPTPGNTDGATGDFSGVDPYTDTYSDSLADIAMKYYKNNLVPGFPEGKVPVSSQCNVDEPDAQLDCNTDLHMVTYTVGLGAKGTIFNNPALDPIYNEVSDVYATPVTWPNTSSTRDPTQIDDLYHAAVNGRGEMLNAATPADLEAEMKKVLNSISEQIGSAATVAFNTSVLSTGSVVYQARFNTDKWKGELLSFELNASTGSVAETATWDAGDEIPAHGSRTIYTYNPDASKNKGVLFKAATNTNLSDTDLPAVAISDIGFKLPNTGLTPDLTAKDRLNYLRGERTFEGIEEDTGLSRFRVRNPDTVLGDIVHSAPLFVGNPSLNWPTGDATTGSFPDGANAYSTWKDSIDRTAMVYVGANDGMFHGFNASNGVELMAYIPSMLYSTLALDADAAAAAAEVAAAAAEAAEGTGQEAATAAAAAAAADAATAAETAAVADGLHYLSDPDYSHKYYVDNTPSRSDAYIKTRNADGTTNTARSWRSILVGTLRGGGKGVFALDVTDPTSFADNADSAAKTALWEFDSSDNADLGLTFSRPTIVPTNANDGDEIRWAAIFGNGYNNGGDCRAKLFVLFLDGGLDGTWTIGEGNDYLVLDTEVGSTATGDCNGLSNVAVVDLNGDGKADGAYGGDLKGNMWSFDLCNADNQGDCQTTGWDVAYSSGSGNNAAPAPLFTAKDADGGVQPITSAPIVIAHPTVASGSGDSSGPNTLVLFGTGQYLVDADKSNPATVKHSYYGVWDRGDDSLLRSDLFAQSFEEGFGAGADFRITGTGEPDYTAGNSRDYGWYLDLPDTSEDDNADTGAPERVVTRSVVIGDIVFFNTLVPTVNGCDIGGYGYLMSVLTKNGGRPESSILDVDNNNIINDDDFKTLADSTTNAAVIGKKTDKGILSEPSFLGDKRYESTSKGEIIKDDVAPPGLSNVGRFSWTEIRKE